MPTPPSAGPASHAIIYPLAAASAKPGGTCGVHVLFAWLDCRAAPQAGYAGAIMMRQLLLRSRGEAR